MVHTHTSLETIQENPKDTGPSSLKKKKNSNMPF